MNPQDPNQQPADPAAGTPDNVFQPQVINPGSQQNLPQNPVQNPAPNPQFIPQQPVSPQPQPISNQPVPPPQPQPVQFAPPAQQPFGNQPNPMTPITPAPQENSKVLGILSLVFALIIWPVGLVLGIVTSVKGFKKGDKVLGLMGVASIIVSLVSMVVTFMIYSLLLAGVNFSDRTAQAVNFENGETLSVQVPDGLKSEDTGSKDTKRFSYYEGESREATRHPSVSISAKGENLPEEFKQVVGDIDALLSDKSQPAYAFFNESIQNGVRQSVELSQNWMCKDELSLGDAEKISVEGSQLAMKISLECTSFIDDRKFYGTAYTGFSDGTAWVVVGVALDDLWQNNQDDWQQIFDSIQIAKN
jgi:hypothetical protein